MKDYLKAIEHAHNMWRLQAKFKDLRIHSVVAIGTPGCLDGPRLKNLISGAPSVVGFKGKDKKLRDAVATGISKCFGEWQDKVTVPGLPWYPSFAAWPGPFAPPTPNVPGLLVTCVSANQAKITTFKSLNNAMVGALPADMKDSKALLIGIASTVSIYFNLWLMRQQVMNVLGRGPVPTYAPPAAPTGPVVGGDNVATPGHLAHGTPPRLAP